MRNFAEILKEERERLALSQTDLGKKLNCTRYRVADLERGRIMPAIADIDLLCTLFGVSSDYLLGRTEIRTTDLTIRKISEYTGLSEDAISLLNSYKDRRYDHFPKVPEVSSTLREKNNFSWSIYYVTPTRFINKFIADACGSDLFSLISSLTRLYIDDGQLRSKEKYPFSDFDNWAAQYAEQEQMDINKAAMETMIEREFCTIAKEFAEEQAKLILMEDDNG